MEITANAAQTISAGGIVIFTDTAVNGGPAILHRPGSGLVALRGLTNQCRARFRVTFGANVALPEGATATEPIILAIAVNGEPLGTATMISTPGAVDEYNNIGKVLFLDIAAGCCAQVSVENIGTTDVSVQNANFIVERVA